MQYHRYLVTSMITLLVGQAYTSSRSTFAFPRSRLLSRLVDAISESSFCSVHDHLTVDNKPASDITPRQITNAHYCNVIPEPCSKPYLIAASPACINLLNLPPEAAQDPTFTQIFSGNLLAPGLDKPYSMNYGCHSYGHWFGQLGDGRAMALGELRNARTEETFELQLKGCGRSPFSRSFDGRAVVRSSVREFLASEAMHHLNVSTTRALCVVGTGDTVARPWYSATSTAADEDELIRRPMSTKYPPNMMKQESGAIVCRVARSFLRLGHLELFAIRKEYKELLALADFVCLREFPSLLSLEPTERYIELYRQVVKANAELVVEWLRVGYVQGNMNSDNTCLAGRTIDYGPFGWMEAYDPTYQPFTTDRDGKFAFIYQPSAMQLNLNVLGERAFTELIRESLKLKRPPASEQEVNAQIERVYKIANEEFPLYFWGAYAKMKQRKLGLQKYSDGAAEDTAWWTALEKLLVKSKADYTMFFRLLADAADGADAEAAYVVIARSFNVEDVQPEEKAAWLQWLQIYLSRIQAEQSLWSAAERRRSQNRANPKYILRNWMAVKAYESAEVGDHSVVEEIYKLLADPYAQDESAGAEAAAKEEKWFKKTPSWAANMPGCTFMSCSS